MSDIDKIRAVFLTKYKLPENVVETEGGYRVTDYTDPFSVGFVDNFGKFQTGYLQGRKSIELREVRGDAGTAVAEMLLDTIAERDNRIKELEERLREYVSFTEEMIDSGEAGFREALIQKRAISALNKEQK